MIEDAEFLSKEEQGTLLRIARDALHAYVKAGKRIDLNTYPLTPTLQECHGAFVTLRRAGALRGCIGYIRGSHPLATAVRDNAINAAVRDPRFPPVHADELEEMEIEISALCPGPSDDSPFIPLHAPDEIQIGRDGLYLEQAGDRGGGLLLPQVAVEQGWNQEQFLEGLCRKAGAPPNAWRLPGTRLYRFRAQVFGTKKQ